MRLLTIRPRGRAELARLLEQRGFERGAVLQALDRLEREKWLDDLSAARSVARSQSPRYGRARIERALLSRGFSRETIAQALGEIEPVGEETALSRAFSRLWQSSLRLAPEKRRQRVWNALARRGFAPDLISAMIKRSDEID